MEQINEKNPEVEQIEATELAPLDQQACMAPTMLTDTKQLNTLTKVAKMYSQSSLIPEAYRGSPADCFVACEMANRMGVSPMMVLQNMYVVKGRPGWSGQACIAIINGTGLFSPLDFEWVGTPGTDDYGCYATATRKSDGKQLIGSTITMGLVKSEGWLDKNGSKWKTMPQQMFKYRAAAFFARIYCPNALMGFQTVEELQDINGIEDTGKTVITVQKEG